VVVAEDQGLQPRVLVKFSGVPHPDRVLKNSSQ
jgi:hypothetical protein